MKPFWFSWLSHPRVMYTHTFTVRERERGGERERAP